MRGTENSKDNRFHDRRHHVADQPGFARSLKAIGTAVFLGVMVRSWMSSDFVHERLTDASRHIHRDLIVDFGEARISLADGVLPEFAVVVEKIKFESANTCWASPIGEIDEVRMPLDWWQVFRGQLTISRVVLGRMDLQLRSAMGDCSAAQAEAKIKPALPPAPPPPVNNTWGIELNSRGPVQQLDVRSMRIRPFNLPATDIDIDHLRIDKIPDAPDHFRIAGHLNLGGLTFSGDFTSHAQFEVDYVGNKAAIDVRGSWREGKYTLSAKTDLREKNYEASGHIEHLPLNQIFNLLKKYSVNVGEFDGRQVWLNLDFSTVGTQAMNVAPLMRVDRLNVEGDMGAIEGGNFVISKWSPIELSSTGIYLRGFKLEKVLSLLGRDKKPESFGNLGEVNGVFRSLGPRQFEISGEFSGLELVFSNRGERRTQLISLMSGHLQYNQGFWSFTLDKIRPYEGLLLGQVKLRGQDGKGDVDVELHVEEMHLGPEVQALMSGGGSLGRWAGDLKGTIDKNGLRRLQGQVFAQDLMVEGLDLPRVKATFTTVGERMQMEIASQSPSVREGSRVHKLLETLVAPFAQRNPVGVLNARDATMTIDFVPNVKLHWRMRPTLFADLLVRTDGQWNQNGQLDGRVVVSRRGEEKQWKIKGNRDAPEFVGTTVSTGVRSEANPVW